MKFPGDEILFSQITVKGQKKLKDAWENYIGKFAP